MMLHIYHHKNDGKICLFQYAQFSMRGSKGFIKPSPQSCFFPFKTSKMTLTIDAAAFGLPNDLIFRP